jgi:tetratricopeptide (TPR) repeat protein
VRSGAVGLPWVVRIERDDEQYWKMVLTELPTSAEAWKRLITFYLTHHRVKDAAQAAQRYVELRPDDHEYICDIAGMIAVGGLQKQARALLEPLVAGHPNYWVNNVLAFLLHKQGDDTQSVKLYQAAIKMEPENAQAYFELGYAYKDMGRPEEAIAMFKKVLQYRPIFPEIDEQIRMLGNQVAARVTSSQ